VAREVSRREIWGFRSAAPDKKRPVLVISRQEVIGLLHTVLVAPITSTIHGLPSEVVVGEREGLRRLIGTFGARPCRRGRSTATAGLSAGWI
jgi:mRNA-degrading endonuclease toxin of MazEF toxin-antitoxin module